MKDTFPISRSPGIWIINAILLGILLHLFSSLTQGSEFPIDPKANETLWERALDAFSKEDYAVSSQLFSQWVDTSGAKKIHSPEAHFNLALSLARQDRTALSVENLLLSASLSSSPLHLWRVRETLKKSQKQLGLTDSLTDSFGFNLFLLFPSNITLVILISAGWMILGMALFLFGKKNRFSFAKKLSLFAFPFCLFAFGLILLINRYYSPRYGVIVAEGTVPVYSEPEMKNTIIQLPPGTLVSVTAGKKDPLNLQGPIVGWIHNSVSLIP